MNARTPASRSLNALVARARATERWFAAPDDARVSEQLDEIHRAVDLATHRQTADADFLGTLALAVVCHEAGRAFALQNVHGDRALDAFEDHAEPLLAAVMRLGERLPAHLPDIPSIWDWGPNAEQQCGFFEQLLARYDGAERTLRGVFYTPRVIARWVVEQVHRQLQDDFGLADGLADETTWSELAASDSAMRVPPGVAPTSPFVRVLDPAAGAGVFLTEVVGTIHTALVEKWRRNGIRESGLNERWNDYVPRSLLPRLHGFELLLPAAMVAFWQVVECLLRTGYRFAQPARVQLRLVDTLACPDPNVANSMSVPRTGSRQFVANPIGPEPTGETCSGGVALATGASVAPPFTVVVGNPPFSGISGNQGRWIRDLLRGRATPGDPADYYFANGRPLGERKLWLQDDYVKFLRYAQWQIATAGCGIAGLITNHGLLDNVTFRGVREQLLHDFPNVRLLDLHGNVKKKEVAPGGRADANVFPIEQGVCISFLCKPAVATCRSVEHGELWGSRVEKLEALQQNRVAWQKIRPAAPYHFFTSGGAPESPEYARAWSLADAMPINTTAAVTARDSFVVAFSRDELLDRMRMFRDLSITDAEIRRRFFTSSRSTRYPPGDTRGWRLADARQRMARDSDWQRHVQTCWYRACDRRFIYWTDWMIDWPRTDVLQHLARPGNLALVARRQMLPTQCANYFWITDAITLDGIIRSDNRGTESVFPLYVGASDADSSQPCRRANFAPRFLDEAQRTLGLSYREPAAEQHASWNDNVRNANDGSFTAADLFFYIHALFHASAYRLRHAAALRVDFPRVLLPGNAAQFRQMSVLGARLARISLLENSEVDHQPVSCRDRSNPSDADACTAPSAVPITSGFPVFREATIWLNADFGFCDVSAATWDFRVGAHQVCRKWLRDRRGRSLDGGELATYRRVLAAVEQVRCCITEIDRLVNESRNWGKLID